MPSKKSDFKKRRAAVRDLDDKGSVAGYLDAAQRLVEDFPKRSLSTRTGQAHNTAIRRLTFLCRQRLLT